MGKDNLVMNDNSIMVLPHYFSQFLLATIQSRLLTCYYNDIIRNLENEIQFWMSVVEVFLHAPYALCNLVPQLAVSDSNLRLQDFQSTQKASKTFRF